MHSRSVLNCRMLSTAVSRQSTSDVRRRGAMVVLITALLVLLIVMTLFTVDVAYMQLTRSELRAATDAACKAGAEAMQHVGAAEAGAAARQAAIAIAAKNTVGGQPLRLVDDDIELGRSVRQPNGAWTFQPGLQPYTAVRVNGEMGGDSANAPVRLFFGGIFGSGTFKPSMTATASNLRTEICLCLDRSNSMVWTIPGPYPAGMVNPAQSPPHPTSSRWASLVRAIDLFRDAVEIQLPRPRVGLVTWASDTRQYAKSYLPAEQAEQLMNVSTIECPLQESWSPILSALEWRSTHRMPGRTNVSAGLDAAVNVMLTSSTVPTSNKVIILLTDGEWNEGRHPVDAAYDAAAAGIVVHVITLMTPDEDGAMDQIAEITGGQRYHAATEAALIAAFEEIARQLPVVLTE